MNPDYKIWLKERGYADSTVTTYYNDTNTVEKDRDNLENHFANETYQDVIDGIKYKSASGYKTALRHYRIFLIEQNITTYDEYQERLEEGFKNAQASSHKDRIARLSRASKKPRTKEVTKTEYIRNDDVRVEVLYQANGICEKCKNKAPFIRKKGNTPYLEVHHIIQLANGGDDTVENAQALCPNCHREAHFG